jgi:hypothetical protein
MTPCFYPPEVSRDDARAILAAASAYLRALYADTEGPHATRDTLELARLAESWHHTVPRA